MADSITGLEPALKRVLLQQAETTIDYDRTRADVVLALKERTDIGDEAIQRLLEAFERGSARYGGAEEMRITAEPENTSGRDYDTALRDRVDPALFTRFVTALKTHRAASATAYRLAEQTYTMGGGELVNRLVDEVQDVKGLRREIIDIAKTVNPTVKINNIRHIIGKENDYDPLRQTLSVALDITQFDPRQKVYRDLWSSVEHLLTPREQAILDKKYIGPDRQMAAAEAFAKWAAPDGARKPDHVLSRAFAPAMNFFERVANVARGRGFQTRQDVWRHVQSGTVATRKKDDTGIRVPDQADNRAGYRRYKTAIGKMSDGELAKAIAGQHDIIFAERKKLAGLLSNKRMLNSLRLNELIRGRAILTAASRQRQRQLNSGLSGTGGPETPSGGPEPSLSPSPGFSLPRNVVNFADFTSASAEVDTITGSNAIYHINDINHDPARNGFKILSIKTPEIKHPVDLGSFRNREVADIFINAIDQTASAGTASQVARDLARRANAAELDNNSLADIDTIIDSGLLDERLNTAISQKDALALAYPLKTGDIVWSSKETGQWSAGTFPEFMAAVAGSEHNLTTAAGIISSGRHTDRRAAEPDRRVWLSVPPSEEGVAVLQGAVYDDHMGKFYAPTPEVAGMTKKWQTDTATAKTARERGVIAGDRIIDPDNVDNPAVAGGLDPAVLRRSRQAAGVAAREARPLAAGVNPLAARQPTARDIAAMSDSELTRAHRRIAARHLDRAQRIAQGGEPKDTSFRALTGTKNALEAELKARRKKTKTQGRKM